MAGRHSHYEAAFADYLRSKGWPYVAVDEQRKAIFAGAKVKSFDFLVYPPGRSAWIVDVKGRKFPYASDRGERYWENWITRDDIEGLSCWDEVFGDGFESVLVFVYWLLGPAQRFPQTYVHQFRDAFYAFFWVGLHDYGEHARLRSPRWDTVSVGQKTFRSLARPVDEII